MIDEDEPVDPAMDSPPRRRWRMRVSLIAGTVAGLAILGVWSQRRPLADDFVRGELDSRGMRATYRVAEIGLYRQLLRDVVIGDPADPDLVARSVVVDTRFGWGGIEVVGLGGQGVRLRGRLVNGTLRLGEVDRLLPPPSGRPFALPDLPVTLADARLRLETPAGVVALRVDGAGNLADGFDGRAAAVATRLAAGGCTLAAPGAAMRVRIDDRSPRLTGPLRFAGAQCGDTRLASGAIGADVTFREAFDGWRGRLIPQLAGVRSGALQAAGVSGAIDFTGSRARTSGNARLSIARFASRQAQGEGLGIDGAFLTGRSGERFDGIVSVRRADLGEAFADRAGSIAGSAAGTPIAPLLDRAATAAARAGRAFTARAALAIGQRDGRGWAALSGIDARGANGARFTLAGGDGLRFGWPDQALAIDGTAILTGGGLPTVRARLAGQGGALAGTLELERYATGDAALALAPTRFAVTPAGATSFRTVATVSGPLSDGRIDDLEVPLAGTIARGGQVAINPDCTWLAFRRLQVSGLVLDPARLRLCPTGSALVRVDGGVRGGARIAAPRLSGRLGSTPITLAAAGSDVSLERDGFAIDGLAARLGREGAQTRLDFGRFEGAASGGAVGGSFASAGGQIANVPLILADAAGRWRLANGVLDVTGATGVSDEQAAAPRFRLVRVPDVALRLANDVITTTGTITEPTTATKVADVAITHRLGTGSGEARLTVPGIVFAEKQLQPEALTPLTLGVVANVRGTVTGEGRIAWDQAGVTSTGRFATEGMDLAAPFGPVTGLSTTVAFTDLLGLVSAPGQLATVAEVNPGIAVEDGRVRYRLLEGQRIGIEGGQWPFAGGTLTLEPTTLDFAETAERRLTFRVDALDAAKFIQQMEFENIAATGIFDGNLPMVFDRAGGRIVDGALTVRPGGGRLSYVGDVSNADLGMFAKLAFDALKSIRYDRLTIELDGALDGEIVSQIRFNGVNQGTPEAQQSALLKQFTGLPFLFNITIRAPFRGLVSTARSFSDPTGLVRDQLAPNASSTNPTVQPQESEPVP